MFDIGFTEILLVLVVTLLVVGPDRLPATARTLGLWFGRLKYQFQLARREFDREIGTEDIRRQLHNERVMHELGESREAIQQVMQDADQKIQSIQQSVNQDTNANKNNDNG